MPEGAVVFLYIIENVSTCSIKILLTGAIWWADLLHLVCFFKNTQPLQNKTPTILFFSYLFLFFMFFSLLSEDTHSDILATHCRSIYYHLISQPINLSVAVFMWGCLRLYGLLMFFTFTLFLPFSLIAQFFYVWFYQWAVLHIAVLIFIFNHWACINEGKDIYWEF